MLLAVVKPNTETVVWSRCLKHSSRELHDFWNINDRWQKQIVDLLAINPYYERVSVVVTCCNQCSLILNAAHSAQLYLDHLENWKRPISKRPSTNLPWAPETLKKCRFIASKIWVTYTNDGELGTMVVNGSNQPTLPVTFLELHMTWLLDFWQRFGPGRLQRGGASQVREFHDSSRSSVGEVGRSKP